MAERRMVIVVLLAGCARWVANDAYDVGTACLYTGAEAPWWYEEPPVVSFAVGEPLHIAFTASEPYCFSSSCTRDEVASCSASIEGGVITITADMTWESHEGPGGCTTDCQVLTTTCEIGALEAGTWTVRLGTGEPLEFLVPSKQQACVTD